MPDMPGMGDWTEIVTTLTSWTIMYIFISRRENVGLHSLLREKNVPKARLGLDLYDEEGDRSKVGICRPLTRYLKRYQIQTWAGCSVWLYTTLQEQSSLGAESGQSLS